MKKREALFYIIFLYLLILCLPVLGIVIDTEIYDFFDLPLTVLLPTLIVSAIYRRKSDISFSDFYRLRTISLKNVILITLIVFLLPPIIGLAINISSVIFPQLPNSADFIESVAPADAGLYGRIIFLVSNLCYIAVFPGICEEFLFRGSIWHLFTKFKFRVAFLVVLNATMFAVFHWNIHQLLYTFVLGIIFTVIAYRTDSIWSSIYAHTLYNAIVDLPLYFDEGASVVMDALAYWVNALEGSIVAAICTVLIIFLLRFIKVTNIASS